MWGVSLSQTGLAMDNPARLEGGRVFGLTVTNAAPSQSSLLLLSTLKTLFCVRMAETGLH